VSKAELIDDTAYFYIKPRQDRLFETAPDVAVSLLENTMFKEWKCSSDEDEVMCRLPQTNREEAQRYLDKINRRIVEIK